MRAIVVRQPGGAEELVLDEVATPEPGAGEVRIQVVAAGVNRADVLQRRGYYPPPAGVSEIIGLEVSGVVDAVGPSCPERPTGTVPGPPTGTVPGPPTGTVPGPPTGTVPGSLAGPAAVPLRPGDEVVALLAGGGYAEHVVVPAGQCAPPPRRVGLVEAAGLMETAATVVSNFDHIGVAAGETILIHGGAGGIGSFAIPYAKHLGLRVLTTVGSADKAIHAHGLGADQAFDYHGDWAEQVRTATAGAGVDAILDIIGAKYLEANVGLLARGGRMTVIGLQGGTKGTLDLNRLLTRGATITATSLRFRPSAEKAEIVRQVAERVWPLFESGAIPLPPLTTFPLDEAAAAHTLLESGQALGKIVLQVHQISH